MKMGDIAVCILMGRGRAMSERQPSGRSPERPPVAIKPVRKKVGEGPKNLRQREEWFKRRTSGQPKRRAT